MPIHLHLDLPTLPTPTLKPSSQSSPPRTLYHFKRLKDKDTRETFTKASGKKVSRIAPTIQKLHVQLQGTKISPQSFADTANSEITSILSKTVLEIWHKYTPPHTHLPKQTHTYNPPGPTTTLLGCARSSSPTHYTTSSKYPCHSTERLESRRCWHARLPPEQTQTSAKRPSQITNRKKACQITREHCMRPWRCRSTSRPGRNLGFQDFVQSDQSHEACGKRGVPSNYRVNKKVGHQNDKKREKNIHSDDPNLKIWDLEKWKLHDFKVRYLEYWRDKTRKPRCWNLRVPGVVHQDYKKIK